MRGNNALQSCPFRLKLGCNHHHFSEHCLILNARKHIKASRVYNPLPKSTNKAPLSLSITKRAVARTMGAWVSGHRNSYTCRYMYMQMSYLLPVKMVKLGEHEEFVVQCQVYRINILSTNHTACNNNNHLPQWRHKAFVSHTHDVSRCMCIINLNKNNFKHNQNMTIIVKLR